MFPICDIDWFSAFLSWRYFVASRFMVGMLFPPFGKPAGLSHFEVIPQRYRFIRLLGELSDCKSVTFEVIMPSANLARSIFSSMQKPKYARLKPRSMFDKNIVFVRNRLYRTLWGSGIADTFILVFSFLNVSFKAGPPVGYMYLALLGHLFRDWRHLIWAINALIPVVFIMAFFVMESPKWYIEKSRLADARRVFLRIAKINGVSLELWLYLM